MIGDVELVGVVERGAERAGEIERGARVVVFAGRELARPREDIGRGRVGLGDLGKQLDADVAEPAPRPRGRGARGDRAAESGFAAIARS
jgi:hypothetical protein